MTETPGGPLLLVTSTIAPRADTFLLSVRDPATRRAQYRAALGTYLGLLERGVFAGLVYADNSGHPLGELEALAAARGLAGRTEFLSFAQDVPGRHSRLYLEMLLVAEAMRRSAWLGADPARAIWKVTGRYVVANAAAIVASRPADADLYLNLRNWPERTVDFYFLAFRAGLFASHLARDLDAFAGPGSGEAVLRRRIDAGAFGDLRTVPRFRVTPRLEGVRGYDGAAYGSARDRAKYALRRAANHLLPGLWI